MCFDFVVKASFSLSEHVDCENSRSFVCLSLFSVWVGFRSALLCGMLSFNPCPDVKTVASENDMSAALAILRTAAASGSPISIGAFGRGATYAPVQIIHKTEEIKPTPTELIST